MSPGISVSKIPIPFRYEPGVFMSAGEAAIRAGNTVAWYDSSDLTTITKDGGNLVSRWNDKLLSGHDLIQATGTNQPLWVVNDGVLFDGVDNFMRTATFPYIQPEFIYAVVRQVTWINTRKLMDGYDADSAVVWELAGSPNLQLYAGTGGFPVNGNLAVNTWGIMRMLWSGAATKFIINNTVPTTGNPGTPAMNGVCLGARFDGLSGWSNVQFKEVIYRNISDNAVNEVAIYNYLATKYGFATI